MTQHEQRLTTAQINHLLAARAASRPTRVGPTSAHRSLAMPSRLPWTDCSLPGCPGTRFLVSSGLFEGGSETVVQLLDGHGWEVVDRLVGALSVVPVDPFQGCCLDVADVAPGPLSADQFGLVQADRGLGQGIVVGLTG